MTITNPADNLLAQRANGRAKHAKAAAGIMSDTYGDMDTAACSRHHGMVERDKTVARQRSKAEG